MSDIADHYRKLADTARLNAANTQLPNVRQLHLRSAERFDNIVEGFNSVAQAKFRNEEAKQNANPP